MSFSPNYPDSYKRKVFDTWVLAGRCSAYKLIELIPVNDQGEKPSQHTLLKWMEEEGWAEHADEISVEVAKIADQNLIQTKAEMLRIQYADAVEIAAKAKTALIGRGFDTSAAAVAAYFKSTEEQRKVAGLAEFMEKIGNMTDEQIETEIGRRLEGMKDVIEGKVVEEDKSNQGDEMSANAPTGS